ncbi:MAG TPA: hypothetical protein VFZ73_02955 [Gemmatimonadaceae bacterium]
MPIVGAGLYTYRRRYITIRGLASRLAILLLAWSTVGVAQGRVLERHGFDDPEGRLLAFYSAAMAFSPAGNLPDESRLSLALEVSHVPYLNRAQRRPSIDKPESTNLAPFFPRPRAAVRLGAWGAEVSWIPPMRVFDVEANLASAAIMGPAARIGRMTLRPRVWGTIGRVRGAMTCSIAEMVGHGADLELYYNTVCYGRESDDWFEPRVGAGEVVAQQSLGSGDSRIYAVLGGRFDRTRFDIGVLTHDGERDPDHPILELRTFRPHGGLGVSWRLWRGVHAGGELFYAPGSLVTARLSGRWVVRP